MNVGIHTAEHSHPLGYSATPISTPTPIPQHTKPQPFLRWRPTPKAASFGPGFIPIAPQPLLAQVHIDIWA